MDYYYNSLRFRAIAKYGGKCILCGFSDWRALQFDHVDGKGREERRLTGRNHFLEDILVAPPGKYQLLCANCNWIKKYLNREGTSRNANANIVASMRKFEAIKAFEESEDFSLSFC